MTVSSREGLASTEPAIGRETSDVHASRVLGPILDVAMSLGLVFREAEPRHKRLAVAIYPTPARQARIVQH